MADETSVSHAIHGKRGSSSVDRLIADLAEGQHGVVGRRQLIQHGVGLGAIEGRLARGQLHRIQRGAYAVGHRSLSREGRWMAVVLSAGPDAVLSHRSAGQLWQLLPPAGIAPELTRPTTFRSRSGLRAHCSPLPSDELTRLEGIPVTSVHRTLLDLAALIGPDLLEKVLNEVEVRGLTDRLSIPDLLRRYPRRRGTAVLRALLEDRTRVRGVPRSQLEGRFAGALASTDLPRPHLNAHVAVGGRFFQADALWRNQRVIVELDGRASHDTDRAFDRDRERDRLLMADGWRVVRVTWRQLRDDAPAVIADLRKLLRREVQAPTL